MSKEQELMRHVVNNYGGLEDMFKEEPDRYVASMVDKHDIDGLRGVLDRNKKARARVYDSLYNTTHDYLAWSHYTVRLLGELRYVCKRLEAELEKMEAE